MTDNLEVDMGEKVTIHLNPMETFNLEEVLHLIAEPILGVEISSTLTGLGPVIQVVVETKTDIVGFDITDYDSW